MIFPFRRRPLAPEPHAQIYLTLVEQARHPAFFGSLGVPDTVDGRFDMIIVHAFLLLERLRGNGEDAEALGQRMFDHMVSDLDVNLREMGVGDLGVGKKVKKMGEAFYGRSEAYRRGLRDADDAALVEALWRNIYRDGEPRPAHLAALAGYMRREAAALRSRPVEALLKGDFAFGPPPVVEEKVAG